MIFYNNLMNDVNAKYIPPKEYEVKNKDFTPKTKPTSAAIIVIAGIVIVAAIIAGIIAAVIGIINLIKNISSSIESQQYSVIASLDVDEGDMVENYGILKDSIYTEEVTYKNNSCGEARVRKFDIKTKKTLWISELTPRECVIDGVNESDDLYIRDDGAVRIVSDGLDLAVYDKNGAVFLDYKLTPGEWYKSGELATAKERRLATIDNGTVRVVDYESKALISEPDSDKNWKKSGYDIQPSQAFWTNDGELAIYYRSCKEGTDCKDDFSIVRRVIEGENKFKAQNEVHCTSDDCVLKNIKYIAPSSKYDYALSVSNAKDGRKKLDIIEFKW